ncbi:MAG: histidine kinase [Gemmatimonadota bacterium]
MPILRSDLFTVQCNDMILEPRRKSELHAGWVLWWASLAVWTVLALADAADYFLSWRLEGHPASFWRALGASFPGWEVWALLSPLVFWLARRVPLRSPARLRPILAHFLFSVLVGVFHSLIHATFGWLFGLRPSQYFSRYFESTFLDWLPISILMYWAVVAVAMGFDYYQRFRDEQLHAATLAHQLTEARLEALTIQLHPHFLFNTLNAAVALVRTHDNTGAANVLTQLGDILRHLLRGNFVPQVPLRDELAFLERYLEIERVRFSNRLTYSVHVPEGLLDLPVPNLILQPLVENAIRHGLGSHDNAGNVEVAATADDKSLVLIVRDDGPGLPAGWTLAESGGVGLGNVRSRLTVLYGAAASVHLEPRTPHGVEAIVTLPRQSALNIPSSMPVNQSRGKP